MNINVVNRVYNGVVAAGNSPVQFPDIALLNSIVLMNHSGSTGPIYVGNSGVTPENGFQINVSAGVGLNVDNANRLFVVCDGSDTGEIRYVGS